jgi:hypothetical protein
MLSLSVIQVPGNPIATYLVFEVEADLPNWPKSLWTMATESKSRADVQRAKLKTLLK